MCLPASYVIDAPLRINEFSLPTPGMSRPASFPSPPGIQSWGRSTDAAETVPGMQFGTTNFRGTNGLNYSGRGSVTVGSSDLNGVVVRLRPQVTMSGAHCHGRGPRAAGACRTPSIHDDARPGRRRSLSRHAAQHGTHRMRP